MPQFNNCTIAGHLTKDAELKQTSDSKPWMSINIGVNVGYGEKKTSFFTNIVIFGKQAEWLKDAKKGQFIVGSGLEYNVQEREKDGDKKYYHGFKAGYGSEVAMLNLPQKQTTQSSDSQYNAEISQEDDDLPF